MKGEPGAQIAPALFLSVIIFSRAEEMARSFQGKILSGRQPDGAPFSRVLAAGDLECAHRCLAQATCVSFLYSATGNDTRGICGLYGKNHSHTEAELLPQREFNYVVVQKIITVRVFLC